jgi:glycosyltransferase involved in cell wall biosynthesis
LTPQDPGEFVGRALKLLTERLKISRSQKLTIANIGVVIPTLNEEKNIEDVLLDLRKNGYQNILVIDGMSKDKTTSIATRNGVKVLLQNGKGKGTAIRQALNNGYLEADAIVIMDADGSMDPKEIRSFVEALNKGADIVKGSRFMNGGYSYDMNSLRRFGNMFMVAVVNLLWSAKYTDLCYGFAAFNRQAIKKLVPHLKSESFEIETEIFLKALNLGLMVKEVPSTEFIRKNGESNLNSFRDGFKILMKIAEEFVSSFPKKKAKAVSVGARMRVQC